MGNRTGCYGMVAANSADRLWWEYPCRFDPGNIPPPMLLEDCRSTGSWPMRHVLYRIVEQRLSRLLNNGGADLLLNGKIGLEKESLRVGREGSIAQTPHPRSLGAALTHPYITTDYSEALLELITPPLQGIPEALTFLSDTQKFVYDRLEDELLWATSMPCVVEGEGKIPIARYGHSNLGMMKTVYRCGLGHRYGRTMQVIAGVHFNYSVPEAFWPVYQELQGSDEPARDFIAASYFDMIRNLLRFGWLIPYLFGASPAVCKSFFGGRESGLSEFDAATFYEPKATSLRVGDIGYTNAKEGETGVDVCYDSLPDYVQSLGSAIETPCPKYERIGVCVDGVYRQLNANRLQIENEYYSSVRPKQVLRGTEKPIRALGARGVEYVELRSLDVNAFEPLGVNEPQLRFLEAFMLFCLLHESPGLSKAERNEVDYNQNAVACQGREPGLKLRRDGVRAELREWGRGICEAMEGICELLDQGRPDTPYRQALMDQIETLRDADRTPSARMLAEMRANKEGFYHFAKRMSEQHSRLFATQTPNPSRTAFFQELAANSLIKQKEIEDSDTLSFDEFLARYFAQ